MQKCVFLVLLKNMNLKVFDLMSRAIRHVYIYIYIYIYIKFYETCKCRLDAIVCNVNNIGMKINACVNVRNKLMKAVDKGFIWNPSECKCDKSCDVWEYLD